MSNFAIMAGNIFGTLFRLITFGESHGPAIGGVVEGCPAGLALDVEYILQQLRRRRPGSGPASSSRQEEDELEILSGMHEGITLGTPVAFLIRNRDARPEDYKDVSKYYRPSHADLTTSLKYGYRDPRGGGRASARETAARVVGGAIARLLLRQNGIEVAACTCRIGPLTLDMPPEEIDERLAEGALLGCPDPDLADRMAGYLEELRLAGDTTGGVVQCTLRNVPPGLGEPVFDKLHADLGKAILSIGACRGFEIGSGFPAAAMKGSEHNDDYLVEEDRIVTGTNHSGGVQGGISNGMEIRFRAAFKPVPSISIPQKSVDNQGRPAEVKVSGRHDVCVIPRVIPVVEAMAAMVLADHLLRQRSARI